jgi:hypothetical protein
VFHDPAEAGDLMDYFALQSLNDMASNLGIAEAVVLLGKRRPWPEQDAGRAPAAREVEHPGDSHARRPSSRRDSPKSLTDAEKEVVQARFNGRAFMWLRNS